MAIIIIRKMNKIYYLTAWEAEINMWVCCKHLIIKSHDLAYI